MDTRSNYKGERIGESVIAANDLGTPISMILHCPRCHKQHIDRVHPGWDNPPHRSHLCLNGKCRTIWRPADVPTNGVDRIKTKGLADSWEP